MYGKIKEHLQNELKTIEENGIFKTERIITSPQGAEITISTGEKVLNFCSNNYMGSSRSNSSGPRYLGYTWIWDVFCSIYLRNSGYSQNT